MPPPKLRLERPAKKRPMPFGILFMCDFVDSVLQMYLWPPVLPEWEELLSDSN